MILICIFLFFFSIYFVKLEKNKSLLLSIGIVFLVELLWELISCAYLDFNKAYIIETARTSYYTGAFIRMIILYLPFMIILSSKNSGKIGKAFNVPICIKKINKHKCIRYILFLTLLVVCYCTIDMIVSGIPLFSDSIGRQNFSHYSKLPFAMKLNGEITFFGIIVSGIAFFNEDNKTNKYLAILIFVISIIFRLLMEYKYHGMYNIFYAFFLPGLINWYKKKNYHFISLKNILKVLSILSIALILSYYTYSNVNKKFDTKRLLMDRIFALQAHTFWEMDEKAWVLDKNIDGYSDSLKKEIDAVKNGLGEMDKNSGIANVMFKISSYESVTANLDNGVRWSGSYLTVGINTIGYLGTFILSFVFAILVLFDMKIFYASLKNYEFLILYFAQSFMWDLLDYFRIGNWCILLNIKTILTLVILLIMYFLKKYYLKNMPNKYGVSNG